MTTIFFDIKDEIYIVKCLAYNIKNRSYKIDTEIHETWEKVYFSCPPESTNFTLIESLLKSPPPTEIVSMYQTIWIIDFSLIEPNRNYSKSTWWQQDAFESWHLLQVDTIFSARRTINNYNLLDTGRKSLTSQIAGYWESTRDNPCSHNSPSRRVRHFLFDSKNF